MSFPISPVNGATTVVNGITYIYNATNNAWKRQTLIDLSLSGNVTAGYFLGNGALLSGIVAGSSYGNTQVTANLTTGFYGNILPAANVTYSLGSPTKRWKDLWVSGSTIYIGSETMSVDASGQWSFTSNGGTVQLSSTSASLAGNLTTNGWIIPTANTTQNIGTTTSWWGTFYGISTQAKYADLAEKYQPDAEYEPGTVLIFGGAKEVTTTSLSHDTRVAGVVSTNPGYLMNAASEGLPVAFTGRVPCLVRGPVDKGTVLVTSNLAGAAEAINSSMFRPGCILGKSLEQIVDHSVKVIEVVVGRF